MPKRNPKTKRVHGDDNKFISESEVDEPAPFGYNDEDGFTISREGIGVLLMVALAGLWYMGLLPV